MSHEECVWPARARRRGPCIPREEGRGSANPARSFAPRDLGPRTICSGVMLAICFCANAIISGVIFEGSIVRVRGRSRRPQRSTRSRVRRSADRVETHSGADSALKSRPSFSRRVPGHRQIAIYKFADFAAGHHDHFSRLYGVDEKK